jgi:hypothetical protein
MAAEFTTEQRWNFVARAALSAIIVAAGLYIIIWHSQSDAAVKWAIGAIGVVIGYWFR